MADLFEKMIDPAFWLNYPVIFSKTIGPGHYYPADLCVMIWSALELLVAKSPIFAIPCRSSSSIARRPRSLCLGQACDAVHSAVCRRDVHFPSGIVVSIDVSRGAFSSDDSQEKQMQGHVVTASFAPASPSLAAVGRPVGLRKQSGRSVALRPMTGRYQCRRSCVGACRAEAGR
jgi:hypothetical protein